MRTLGLIFGWLALGAASFATGTLCYLIYTWKKEVLDKGGWR